MKKLTLLVLAVILLAGCGYSTKSLLPASIKTVYVAPFRNVIPTQELEYQNYKSYRPLLERDITSKVIDEFIYDKSLEVVSKEEEADLTVTGELTGYQRDPLRYTLSEEIEEYRLTIFVNVKVENKNTEAIMWEENNFAGDTTYFTSGSQAKSESTAIGEAIDDLARRVIERTVEMW